MCREHRRQGSDAGHPHRFGEEGLVDFEVLSEGGMRWDLEGRGGGVGALNPPGRTKWSATWCATLPRRSASCRGARPSAAADRQPGRHRHLLLAAGWRSRYGCSPAGMGGIDESVSIAEFHHVLRVHALAAADYLAATK